MRVLILTQSVDLDDPVLGFFHRWIEALSLRFESIDVVCLKKGRHDLPANVALRSLGKEEKASRIQYVFRFYHYIWKFREEYDAVFVHMNQEYVLLGWPVWAALGKSVFMWRNHHAGNLLTRMAVAMCDAVFCTSRFSYTARFKKTELMPVGIDTQRFAFAPLAGRPKRSVMFLSRISPVKKPDVLIEAIILLLRDFPDVTCDIFGAPSTEDEPYADKLVHRVASLGLESTIRFSGPITNDDAPRAFSEHEYAVNLASSGMYDKTIFEAMSCGSVSLASNENLHGIADNRLLFKEGDVEDLYRALRTLFLISDKERQDLARESRKIVEDKHSLSSLVDRLYHRING